MRKKIELQTNKRTSFQGTPDDDHYISEKLVKDSLDAKVDGNYEIQKNGTDGAGIINFKTT